MIKLTFLGTKREIEEYTRKHRYHSSILLAAAGFKFLIDYGVLHRYALSKIGADAIFITHAHPDHYVWLKENEKTDIPVYLTQETASYGKFKPVNSIVIETGETIVKPPFSITAYRVIHSIRCPAVGYKIAAYGKTLVYNPDLVDIVDKDDVLKDVDYYIGDGSSIRANLVRRREGRLFGHARITTQINWCKKYDINSIVFTHLGKETIAKEKEFVKEHPEVILAYDGMELELPYGK